LGKIALIVLLLPGCAAYTATSVGVWGATGKGITEHGASVVTGADCKITHIGTKYLCEQPREAGTTYNRNPF
jgi:3D (Asp-Asp-Asp) domain-containing protein